MSKYLFLDCDSTLCAIEGVDELAALRGSETEREVIELTNRAMDGTVPITEVFTRRLDLSKPTKNMCEEVGQMYIERLSPHAESTINELQKEGWEVIIISGGFTPVIAPVAAYLNIKTIFAVNLLFDEAGEYQCFDTDAPTARNGGKPDIIKDFLNDKFPSKTVMMGDGISDLETQSVVDVFIGYGGVISRQAVQTESQFFLTDFKELPKIISITS